MLSSKVPAKIAWQKSPSGSGKINMEAYQLPKRRAGAFNAPGGRATAHMGPKGHMLVYKSDSDTMNMSANMDASKGKLNREQEQLRIPAQVASGY